MLSKFTTLRLQSCDSLKAASLEDALDEMSEVFLEKKDPVRKAERVRPQLVPDQYFDQDAQEFQVRFDMR